MRSTGGRGRGGGWKVKWLNESGVSKTTTKVFHVATMDHTGMPLTRIKYEEGRARMWVKAAEQWNAMDRSVRPRIDVSTGAV